MTTTQVLNFVLLLQGESQAFPAFYTASDEKMGGGMVGCVGIEKSMSSCSDISLSLFPFAFGFGSHFAQGARGGVIVVRTDVLHVYMEIAASVHPECVGIRA